MPSTLKLSIEIESRAPSFACLTLGGLLLSACAGQPHTSLQASSMPTSAPSTSTALPTSTSEPSSEQELRRLEGWVSIIWNDEPHFNLALDDGEVVQLLIDEELTAPLGGPLALDRARVSVLAVAQDAPHLYKVLSITHEEGG